eukprot:8351575-Pyramimonas_sp.AAC.1
MRARESRAGSPQAIISPTKNCFVFEPVVQPPSTKLVMLQDPLVELAGAGMEDRPLGSDRIGAGLPTEAPETRHHWVRTGGGGGNGGETGTETDKSLKRSPNLLALLEPLWSRRPT